MNKQYIYKLSTTGQAQEVWNTYKELYMVVVDVKTLKMARKPVKT